MKDKNFILFGSSGGIGSQLAADLNDCKSKLLVGYHHAIPDYGFSVEKSAPVDASSFESVINFIEEANAIAGEIHGVVSLPGSVILRPPHLITENDFQKSVNVNLKTAFSVLRACGKILDNCSVVFLSTAVTDIGLNNHEMIVAVKAGIESMVKSASLTYATKSLRFNVVAPGLVDTPLTERIVNNSKALEISKKMHPRGRIGSPKDISRMISFLLDPANDWITGQTFRVDGGLSSTKS